MLDLTLRDRLIESLNYIADVASLGSGLTGLRDQLAGQTVSPWVFCLYSKLVAELSQRPQRDITGILGELILASSLPVDQAIVALHDSSVSENWWAHLEVLFNTDSRRDFRPKAPNALDESMCRREVDRGMALLRQCNSDFCDELRALLGLIVLAVPTSPRPVDSFDGGSTFFFWRGAMINAAVRRDPIEAIEVLVHESSHVLLFGLSAEQPLTNNTGLERHVSPVRSDPRPVDGIFHAAFVTTRVHLAMSNLLDSNRLEHQDAKAAIRSLEHNHIAAREAIALLERQALLTEHGRRIFNELCCYWDKTN